MTKKVAIVCDDYKLSKFEKDLTAKGYKYTVLDGVWKYTTTLSLEIEESDMERFGGIVKAINLSFSNKN